jgi:type I restriction enzyme S subunit
MGIVIFKVKVSDISKYQFLRFDCHFLKGKDFINNSKNNYRLGQVFETGRGVVMNKEYIAENEGIYPVYSSQTSNNGVFGSIDSYMFDGEYLTWTTDGAKAGKVFYRYGKFNCTNVCGTAKLKKGFENMYNLKFLAFYLNTVTNYYVSIASGNPKLMNNVFEEIKLPTIDLATQKNILDKIEPLEIEIQELLNSEIKPLSIINQVFGEEFGFDWEFYKLFGKGMTAGTQQSDVKEKLIYKVAFSQIQKSSIVRVSSRFHNPKTQFLNTILFSKPSIKVKNIVSEKVHRGASPNYDADGEIPVIKTAHLKNGYVNISENEFVSYDTYTKSERSQIFINDVLVASTGKVSLGRVDLVEIEQELVADGHISIIRVDNRKYNCQFLTYFLRSILGVFQIERDYTGATNQIELYSSEIENFDIPDFSLDKQAEIVMKIKTQIDAQNVIDQQIEQKQEAISKIIEQALTNS